MALIDLLNQTCDIYKDTLTRDKGEQVKTNIPVYTDIKCSVYNTNYAVKNRVDSQKTDWSNMVIVIQPDKTLVKAGMWVTVYDPAIWELWEFLVDGVTPQRDKDGSLHHIEIALSNKVR